MMKKMRTTSSSGTEGCVLAVVFAIDADSEIAGMRSWGANYGCPPELDRRLG